MQIQVGNLAGADGADREERVAALAAGVKRADGLVNQLLDLARLDAPARAKSESFGLAALLLDCAAEYAPLAEGKNVDIGPVSTIVSFPIL